MDPPLATDTEVNSCFTEDENSEIIWHSCFLTHLFPSTITIFARICSEVNSNCYSMV